MGLPDILDQDSRIWRYSRFISFRLIDVDAIIYSLLHDIRFVTLLCLILGFTVWWSLVPYEVINHPGVLSSPDIGTIVESHTGHFREPCVQSSSDSQSM